MKNQTINFPKIEKTWQKKWEKSKIFQVKSSKKEKYYLLEMYPYPSGSGLHMGHAFNYTIGDIRARFKSSQGFNVLHPTGFDSFGLPAENAAIKAKTHPKKYAESAIKNFIKQMKALGFSYDWSRKIQSHDPEYYKWNQYFFLQFLKNNLAYRKKALVNFCPECDTVLANEQVINGNCWRHEDTPVELKPLEQWFIKTTKYSEELLSEIPKLQWPKRIKLMQENWIGKSEGVNFKEKVKDLNIEFEVYDSIPQTFMAQTFTIIAPDHPLVYKLVKGTKYAKPVMEFVENINRKKAMNEFDIENDIEGIFTGRYVDNPFGTGDLPIWVASFVLADYGTGIVNCSAHDERDFEFAKKYNLPLKIAMLPPDKKLAEKVRKHEICYHHAPEGIIQEPSEFKGSKWKEVREKIINYIEKNNLGKKSINYKLRDWLVSRQRYWGTPIPIIYCDKCGTIPVPEKDLPVKLPEKVKFGKGNPLATNSDFVNTKCPQCKSKAKRETDTMDTFFDSSWYFLRFTDPQNEKAPFSKKEAKHWMPVDFYTGGATHACLHLIYARFFTKALRDLKFLKTNEPFIKLFNQGMIHGSDGHVMSKSRGNVINPLKIIEKYGADPLRLFLVSVAGPDSDFTWDSKGLESSWKFLQKTYKTLLKIKIDKSSPILEHKTNKAIKEITEDIEELRYNYAIIKLRSLITKIEQEPSISKSNLESFIKLLAPFCPHISEELWQKTKHKTLISTEKWPKPDKSKINSQIESQEKALDNTIQDINNILKLVKKTPKTIYLYTLPSETSLYNEKTISKKINIKVKVFAVNDKNKHDPQNKSKKAKPNKPGIYIE